MENFSNEENSNELSFWWERRQQRRWRFCALHQCLPNRISSSIFLQLAFAVFFFFFFTCNLLQFLFFSLRHAKKKKKCRHRFSSWNNKLHSHSNSRGWWSRWDALFSGFSRVARRWQKRFPIESFVSKADPKGPFIFSLPMKTCRCPNRTIVFDEIVMGLRIFRTTARAFPRECRGERYS